jgi:hypothetical protein
MFINCNKTKYITVGTKQKLAFQNEELCLTINSEQLQHLKMRLSPSFEQFPQKTQQ